MTNIQIFLLVWAICAILNLVYLFKSKEGPQILNSDEAFVILILCMLASPLFTGFGLIVQINELSSNLKEQEKEEKKLAEAAKKKAAKTSN